MQAEDLIRIRHEAQSTHERTKLVLGTEVSEAELEVQRDDCVEKKNAVRTVLNHFADIKDQLRSQKRQIDDQIAEVAKQEREFESYQADLVQDEKKCTNEFWNKRRERNLHDNYSPPNDKKA